MSVLCSVSLTNSQFILQLPYGNPQIDKWPIKKEWHNSDAMMSAMASQITGFWFVCSTICSGADHKKNLKAPRHWPLWGKFIGDRWILPHKRTVTWKMFPFDDVIMEKNHVGHINFLWKFVISCFIFNYIQGCNKWGPFIKTKWYFLKLKFHEMSSTVTTTSVDKYFVHFRDCSLWQFSGALSILVQHHRHLSLTWNNFNSSKDE